MRERFDRFADWTADHVAAPWFFVLCVAIVLAWVPTLALMSIDSSQLIINTTTTIITFLLVALLHNGQHRFEEATNERLQVLTEAIEGAVDPVEDEGQRPL